ncbi:glutathione S-transferase family protein [Alphaproteobacteria bacterium]|nr:glutathione S-transferase family protein [Alphaproteobacteria bacterium]
MNNEIIEIWGYKTFRPFRVYWALEEMKLNYRSYKIGSRTGETQTTEYLKINPKGKIPLFRHNEIYISESVAAMNYVVQNFETTSDFYVPNSAKDKAKIDEWSYMCAMELDALGVYILRRHQLVANGGLSNLYGEAPNAIKTAKEHVNRMLLACDKDVPNNNWLIGNSPSCADIMFMSCLQVIKLYKLDIKSDKINDYYERAVKRKQYINAMIESYGQPTLEKYILENR